MSSARHHVTIKGVKEGLIFHLDDSCAFDEVLGELQHKLEKTHSTILTGPQVHVRVKLGSRLLDDAAKGQIRELIGRQSNLLVQSIEADIPEPPQPKAPEERALQVVKGMIRSGQKMEFAGSVMLLGDINPGGSIQAGGDIYIMGSLRGMAHAGWPENDQAIIAASHLCPTQLRIADIISRPPDEWGIGEAYMEFAFIRDGAMQIEKIHNIQRIRPNLKTEIKPQQ